MILSDKKFNVGNIGSI